MDRIRFTQFLNDGSCVRAKRKRARAARAAAGAKNARDLTKWTNTFKRWDRAHDAAHGAALRRMGDLNLLLACAIRFAKNSRRQNDLAHTQKGREHGPENTENK